MITSILLSQQHLVFSAEREVRFESPYSKKKCPVILQTKRNQIKIIIFLMYCQEKCYFIFILFKSDEWEKLLSRHSEVNCAYNSA